MKEDLSFLKKLTKKELIDKIEKLHKAANNLIIRADYYGQKNIFEHFRNCSIESIDERYRGITHVAIIRGCDKEIEKIDKKINELDCEFEKLK